MVAQEHRRSALLRLLAEPVRAEHRPCEGCAVICQCRRQTRTCACGCTPECFYVPTALSRDPGGRPLDRAYVSLIYQLTTIRVFSPFWPTPDHYCRRPTAASIGVLLRTSSLEYADLLAHHIAYLSASGSLSAIWRVSVAAHISGSDATTFSIEPANARRSIARLGRDLGSIADSLASRLHELARVRLFRLAQGLEGTQRSAKLSRREQEVLALFVAGLGVPTIAERLFVSLHTVRNHLKHIYSKYEVTSQRELRELFASEA